MDGWVKLCPLGGQSNKNRCLSLQQCSVPDVSKTVAHDQYSRNGKNLLEHSFGPVAETKRNIIWYPGREYVNLKAKEALVSRI
jgi:hypothetical protein